MARTNRIGARGRWARAGTVAAILLALPSLSSARTELLQWTHPDPASVAGFTIFTGTAPGTYTSALSVASLTPDANGVYSYQISVPDTATVYIAVKAYDTSGALSAFSNERVRAPSGSSPPPPTSPPPPPPPPSITPADDPVDAAATWSDDFAGSVGTQVANWVDTKKWASLAVDDTIFSLVDNGGDLALSTQSTEDDVHSHYVGTDSANWSSYEVRGLMLTTATTTKMGVTAASRWLSAPVNYRLAMQNGSGAFGLAGFPWDTATKSCVSQSTGVVPQANTWYVFRFQVLPQFGSNLLRAKVWAHGTTEPSGWQAECTDSSPSRPATGTVGVWSGGGSGARYWDDLQVIPVDTSTGNPGSGPTLGAPGQPYLIQP